MLEIQQSAAGLMTQMIFHWISKGQSQFRLHPDNIMIVFSKTAADIANLIIPSIFYPVTVTVM